MTALTGEEGPDSATLIGAVAARFRIVMARNRILTVAIVAITSKAWDFAAIFGAKLIFKA